MLRLDNPAGRLHALLTDFVANENASVSVTDAWAAVLRVDNPGDGSLEVALGSVAGLLPALESSLLKLGEPEHQALFNHLKRSWAAPIFCPDRGMNGKSVGLVDRTSLFPLGTLSAALSMAASEGSVPDDAGLAELRNAIAAALEKAMQADDLPAELRKVVVGRLHDLLWALDNVRIVGPAGVKDAAERVATRIAASGHTGAPSAKTVLVAISAVWTAFSASPQIVNALAGWETMLKSIGGG